MTTSVALDANDMINVTKRLIQIIETEIDLIKSMKISQIHTLYDEKMKLSSILESYKSTIANNPHIIKQIPKEEVSEMRSVVLQFEKLLEEDGNQLIKVKKVHQIIMEAIKKVVTKRADSSVGYNKNGELNTSKKNSFLYHQCR